MLIDQVNLSMEFEQLSLCPNCGRTNLQLWCKGYDRLYELSRNEFIYSKCQKCELIFLSLRPRESEIHNFYPINYGPYQPPTENPQRSPSHAPSQLRPAFQLAKSLFGKVLDTLNNAVNQFSPDTWFTEFQYLYRLPVQGAKLLDFGCGSDAFLNSAREQGWQTLGMDFSEQAVNQVHQSGHKAYLVSPAAWDEIADHSLDFVRMNHVLEHIYSPREVLSVIKAKMKPGATLHIALPNPNSITARIFRSRWWGLECPRHVILYSPAGLKHLLRELGFTVHKVIHETITKDFARSLGYFAYDYGRIRHDEIEQMMHRPELSKLLYIPARFAARTGVADRFHTFVKK